MKFGVVIFPGSNCDHDMIYVLKDILGNEVVELWHKDTNLQNVDVVVLPGGFSYGDYLRSGAIAKFSPLMNKIVEFANNGGFVFGICNGFQVLCESGLLPGALLHNDNQKFICRNSFIKAQNKTSIATNLVDTEKVLNIPIAHGEGKYFASPTIIEELNKNNQILFRYCDSSGGYTKQGNPNGSVENIAGISNITGNVFGMMPHPERASDKELQNEDGLFILNSIISYVKNK